MMKVAVFAAALAIAGSAFAQPADRLAPTPPPAGAEGAAPESLLPGLIEHSRSNARIENGRLVGPGADLLRGLGARARFVMIGEEHGHDGIARFAEAYWRDLEEAGYRYAAIEADPWVTEALERSLRAGGVAAWAEYLKAHGGAYGAPFFSWAPEAGFANTVVSSQAARRTPTLWGLDQAFIGAAGPLLRRIAQNARSAEARTLAATLAAEADAAPIGWLGKGDPERLDTLASLMTSPRDRELAALARGLARSHRIYQPFVGDTGEAQLANADREALMKETFLARLRAAETADREAPRVMLKFGANHMMRGATTTHVQGLGGFVDALANMEGGETLSILALCGPGGATGSYSGASEPCPQLLADPLSALSPYVSAEDITVFDLRVWKLRPRRWAKLAADAQKWIDSFDLIVVIPGGGAATWIEGVSPPASN